jgi:hypothetical protein
MRCLNREMPYRRDADPDGLRALSSPFARIREASPCGESWDRMQPIAATDTATLRATSRLCGRCGRNLYNLSAMTESQVDRLIRSLERKPFTRLYRRADGSVLTIDCPVGARAKLRRFLMAAAIMIAAAIIAGASLAR